MLKEACAAWRIHRSVIKHAELKTPPVARNNWISFKIRLYDKFVPGLKTFPANESILIIKKV